MIVLDTYSWFTLGKIGENHFLNKIVTSNKMCFLCGQKNTSSEPTVGNFNILKLYAWQRDAIQVDLVNQIK